MTWDTYSKIDKTAASFQALAVLVLLVGLIGSAWVGTQIGWPSAVWGAAGWVGAVLPTLALTGLVRVVAQGGMASRRPRSSD